MDELMDNLKKDLVANYESQPIIIIHSKDN
jgi:hypothetical protein